METHHRNLNYNEPGIQFLHCAKCLREFYDGVFGKGQSPGEALNYEPTAYPLKLRGNKIARIVAVWCKRCKTPVWDSRHLRPAKSTKT